MDISFDVFAPPGLERIALKGTYLKEFLDCLVQDEKDRQAFLERLTVDECNPYQSLVNKTYAVVIDDLKDLALQDGALKMGIDGNQIFQILHAAVHHSITNDEMLAFVGEEDDERKVFRAIRDYVEEALVTCLAADFYEHAAVQEKREADYLELTKAKWKEYMVEHRKHSNDPMVIRTGACRGKAINYLLMTVSDEAAKTRKSPIIELRQRVAKEEFGQLSELIALMSGLDMTKHVDQEKIKRATQYILGEAAKSLKIEPPSSSLAVG